MFTGIIKETGRVHAIEDLEAGKKISIAADLAASVAIDQSISINGVCHTVVEVDEGFFSVQSIEETLRKTTMGHLTTGDPVNLEPSLRPDQLLDGHLVQGHIDGTGSILAIEKEDTDRLITIRYPKTFQDLITGRGSITVDGISLTVAREANETFTVAIIPYTYEHTTMKALREGDEVNLEFDILGKYVVRYLKNRERL